MSHTTIDGTELRCLNCGRSYEMAAPVPMDIMLASAKAWEKTHKKCKPSPAGAARMKASTPEEWKRSWDTGQSSMTIWSVMMGQGIGPGTVPRDPSDFGRCYRLLGHFPAWRARLGEMYSVDGWPAFVDAWAELEALYVEELNNKDARAPKLYAAMSRLLDRT